jgi:hypothetical protein
LLKCSTLRMSLAMIEKKNEKEMNEGRKQAAPHDEV